MALAFNIFLHYMYILKARSADNRLSPAKFAADNRLSAAHYAADNQLLNFPINHWFCDNYQVIMLSFHLLIINTYFVFIYEACS